MENEEIISKKENIKTYERLKNYTKEMNEMIEKFKDDKNYEDTKKELIRMEINIDSIFNKLKSSINE